MLLHRIRQPQSQCRSPWKLFLIVRTVADYFRDANTADSFRRCVDKGYTPSLDRDRSNTDGLSWNENRGFNSSTGDRVVFTCTPPSR